MNKEEILKEGKKTLEEFSKALEGIPETEETHYVIDLKNITRDDAKPTATKDFTKKLEKLAPKWDDGYIRCTKD
jgi:aspartyl-tRNA(Asn)/glutamyl-tRNA(Gln) amidotransferase subunit C